MNSEEIQRWLDEAGHTELAAAWRELMRKSAALDARIRKSKEEAQRIREHFVSGPETLQ